MDNEHKAAIVSIETRYATASSAASRAEADVSRRRSKAAAVATELDEVRGTLLLVYFVYRFPLDAVQTDFMSSRGLGYSHCVVLHSGVPTANRSKRRDNDTQILPMHIYIYIYAI